MHHCTFSLFVRKEDNILEKYFQIQFLKIIQILNLNCPIDQDYIKKVIKREKCPLTKVNTLCTGKRTRFELQVATTELGTGAKPFLPLQVAIVSCTYTPYRQVW